MAGYNPLLMQKLLAIRKMETDRLASPAFWQEALARMGLSDEQKQDLHAQKCQFRHTLDQLLQERMHIQESLLELEVAEACTLLEPNQRTVWLKDQYRWMQLAQALKDNLDKAHCAMCLFHGKMWRGKLAVNPLQEARLVVYTFPQYPDMVEIVEMISRELGRNDEHILDVDAQASGLGLQPAESLPDPEVDRYLPLEEKLAQAILKFRGLALDPGAWALTSPDSPPPLALAGRAVAK